jgi:hypothetical protein
MTNIYLEHQCRHRFYFTVNVSKTAVENTFKIHLCFNLGLSDIFNIVCQHYCYATGLVQCDKPHSDQQKVQQNYDLNSESDTNQHKCRITLTLVCSSLPSLQASSRPIGFPSSNDFAYTTTRNKIFIFTRSYRVGYGFDYVTIAYNMAKIMPKSV